MCSDSRYILKVEPARVADRFNAVKEKRIRDNPKIIYGLSFRKRWACHFLRWGRLQKEQVQGEETGVWFSEGLV